MFKKSTPEKLGSKEDPKRDRYVYSGDHIYWEQGRMMCEGEVGGEHEGTDWLS